MEDGSKKDEEKQLLNVYLSTACFTSEASYCALLAEVYTFEVTVGLCSGPLKGSLCAR